MIRPRWYAAATVAALSLAGGAWAYVRSVTDKGTPVYWAGSCLWLQPDKAGSPDLPLQTVLDTINNSVANWQRLTYDAGCSFLKFNMDAPAPLEAHLDHVNIVKFRTDKWCRPAETNIKEMCYPSSAAAITTVFYASTPGKAGDGAILDADIELNDLNFTFEVCPEGGCAMDKPPLPLKPGTMIADLENTLTHELGHLQGLDHTCKDPSSSGDPVDNKGQKVPSCDDVMKMPSPVPIGDRLRITEATMFNYANPGEVKKRSPEADDVQGICDIYKKEKDPGSCVRPPPIEKGGGCCAVGGRAPSTSLGGLLLLAGLVLRRRGPREADR